MKLYAIIISCLLTATLNAGCSSRPAPPKQEAEPGAVVLRISTDSYGPVYPKEGDILNISLREDGVFEYDDWPEQAQPTYTAGNVAITRKQARLGLDDVKELMRIAERPDFQNAAETY